MLDPDHYCEGRARLRIGGGFFRTESRPARDLGVLLVRSLASGTPPRVLDLMAGCGIRSLRYGLEAGASMVWANDADPDRLPLLRRNLQADLAGVVRGPSCETAQHLLAGCIQREERFDLVDLDAFGSPGHLLPLALDAVAFGGALYIASTDGRSPTGHDRAAALRRFGAAARSHPASWEIALRLQLALVARLTWAKGHGLQPLFSFSEGRTFRSAVSLRKRPEPGEEERLGMMAHCHRCGDQQVQSLVRLRPWRPCLCGVDRLPFLAVSGPLWIGPLQNPPFLAVMAGQAEGSLESLAPPGRRLLARLAADPADGGFCWPLAQIACLGGHATPSMAALITVLEEEGYRACRSGVMEGQLRSDAPWPRIKELARLLTSKKGIERQKPGDC